MSVLIQGPLQGSTRLRSVSSDSHSADLPPGGEEPVKKLDPGLRELVRRCRALGIPMALATSSAREAVALKAAPHPWLELITVRVHGDDPELRAGKPAPDVFLLAAARLGQPASGCWAFEDSPAGARSAYQAGCRVHVVLPEGGDPAAYPEGVRWLGSLRELEL